YVKAIVRGLLGLLAGALVNGLGAIVLGAPVGIQHFTKTVHWSLLMSVFTFVPAASVFGSSCSDWHRIFAQTKPIGSTDFMICFPAHGAVIGAWFGAWPMPLDWERPWQEWPICVTYGAIFGYLLGLVVSFGKDSIFYGTKYTDSQCLDEVYPVVKVMLLSSIPLDFHIHNSKDHECTLSGLCFLRDVLH
ncbi:UNVERIFIED_CONTAM: Phosphatidylinositol-glycan biosynthesis class F protein, partial [Sesamum radiatum]